MKGVANYIATRAFTTFASAATPRYRNVNPIWEIWNEPIRTSATLSASHLRSPLPVSDPVFRLEDGALADAALRAGFASTAMRAGDPGSFAKWATKTGATQIATPFITRGPLRDWRDSGLLAARHHRGARVARECVGQGAVLGACGVTHALNNRQIKVLNRMLDGFEGKMTSSKWAALAKCSQDTANRDIATLIDMGLLRKSEGGGRSTHYVIA